MGVPVPRTPNLSAAAPPVPRNVANRPARRTKRLAAVTLRLRHTKAERRMKAQFESMLMSDLAAMLSAVLPNMVRRTHRIRLAFTF